MHKENQDVLHNLLVLRRRTRDKGLVTTSLAKEHPLTELMADICTSPIGDRCHSRGGKKFYIQDFSSTTNTLTLLINMIDPSKPAPVARGLSLSAEERQEMGIRPGWGLESSCHVVLTNTEDNENQHILLLEKVDGMTASNVGALLNKCLIRQVKLQPNKFQMEHPLGLSDKEGKTRKINTYYTVQIYGLPDDNFLQQISKGSLDSIDLVGQDAALITGYDSNNDPEVNDIKLGVDCSLSRTQQGAVDKLIEAIGFAKKIQMDKLLIKYHDQSDFPRTANLDVQTNRLINSQRLVKKYKVKTPERPNVSAVSEIDKTLETAMITLLP